MTEVVLFDLDDCLIDTRVLRPYFSDEVPFLEQSLPFADCVYDDVRPTLTQLREKGIRLGIVSQAIRGYKDYQERKAKEIGFSLFDDNLIFIVEAPDKKEEKLEGIIKLLKDIGINIAELLVVDDSPTVLQFAANFGIKTTRIKREGGKCTQEEIEDFQPDYTISTLSELPDLIN